jgi:choline dehydrogenase-like flavoprotein
MGNSPTEGVVNTKGQVFRVDQAAPNKQVYDGLYVMDASVFPGPVAVNPTLSIVALALKIVEGIQL